MSGTEQSFYQMLVVLMMIIPMIGLYLIGAVAIFREFYNAIRIVISRRAIEAISGALMVALVMSVILGALGSFQEIWRILIPSSSDAYSQISQIVERFVSQQLTNLINMILGIGG